MNPGPGRSSQEVNGNPLQYSCLENPMDGGAWPATVHGIEKSRHDRVTNTHKRANNSNGKSPFPPLSPEEEVTLNQKQRG